MVQLKPQPQNNSPYKQSLGHKGETEALEFLVRKGFSLVVNNFKTDFGEIDLIITKGDKLIFVEVKTRTTLSHGNPEEAITRAKLRHIEKSAQVFLTKFPQYAKHNPRIDVVALDKTSGDIRHYEGVYL